MNAAASPARFARSLWVKAVFVALALMWGATGWVILLQGGFTKGYKHSRHTLFVDGWAGAAMALVLLLLAAIALAVVLQSVRARPWCHALSVTLILGVPLVYLMGR